MITLSIGESRPKKFKIGAAVIKAVEGTDHTHSFISWRDTRLDIRKVGEARGGGGRIVPNEQFRYENEVVRIFQYNITDLQLDQLEIWIWKHLRPYGYKHNLGLGLMRLKRMWNPKALNPYKDGDYSLICVEMSAKAIELALGVDLPGDVEDYGLREMHEVNMNNYKSGVCAMAPQEMVDRINGKC